MSWGETIYLRNIIEKHIGVAASDEVLAVLVTDRFQLGNSSYEYISEFKSNANGTIRLSAEVDGYKGNVYFKLISGDGNEMENSYTVSTSELEVAKVDFNVKKGVTYSLQMKSSASSGSLSHMYARNIKVCGSNSDPTLIVKE